MIEDSKAVKKLTADMDSLKKSTRTMRDSLIRSQSEATKLQCRMIGIPKEWRDADLRNSCLWESMPGDTSGKVMKHAKLINGTELQVANFIEIGDMIEIDTREEGSYKCRAKK
jgi:hypothetical protein